MTETPPKESELVKPLKIDIHTHFFPRSLPDFSTRYGYSGFVSLDLNPADAPAGFGALTKGSKNLGLIPSCTWDIHPRLKHMAALEVDVQVLTPMPCLFNYWAKADDTADLCRFVNNSIAAEISTIDETVVLSDGKTSSKAFIGFGILPMQAPELAIVELERCVKDLGFKGVAIGTHINEWNLDAPELVPIWEACEELNCAVMVHPCEMDVIRKDRKYWLPELIGATHQTNRAITTLLLGGVLDRFPKLKICFSDGGGSYPYIHGRVEQGFKLNPEKCATQSEASPDSFLGKFYCDSVVGSSRSCELLIDVVGSKSVLFGTNYPFLPGSYPVVPPLKTEDGHPSKEAESLTFHATQVVANARNLDEEAKTNIYGCNALDFLGLGHSQQTRS